MRFYKRVLTIALGLSLFVTVLMARDSTPATTLVFQCNASVHGICYSEEVADNLTVCYEFDGTYIGPCKPEQYRSPYGWECKVNEKNCPKVVSRETLIQKVAQKPNLVAFKYNHYGQLYDAWCTYGMTTKCETIFGYSLPETDYTKLRDPNYPICRPGVVVDCPVSPRML